MNHWIIAGNSSRPFVRRKLFGQIRQGTLIVALLFSLIASAIQVGPVRAAHYFVYDQFGVAQYNNQNGSASWSTNWTETNDDGAAGAGNVQITGGELLVSSRQFTNDADLEAVQRSVNLSTSASNTLVLFSYSFRSANLDATDTLVVEVYNGTAWTTLETISSANATGIRSWDITAHKNANTAIRFRISGNFDNVNEAAYFDNVEISYLTANTHTTPSLIQAVQTYYVPMPEDQALTAMRAISNNTTPTSPTYVYIVVTVVTDGTIIYYDHWEDGFETLINYPTQSTTEVWGDNDTTNGMPPGKTVDVLNPGEVLILKNPVDTANLGVIDFDGGDKLASTQAISVTRTSWASGSGTLHGGSVEMLDTSIWGTRYDLPVHSILSYDFTYTGVALMAGEDNTSIYRNGSLVGTIDQGQSYFFNDNVALGDTFTSSAPVQATFINGNIGSAYASDWFTLYPYDLLGSSYYANVGPEGTVTTAIVLQNPTDSAIVVNWETTAGAQTPINLSAHGSTWIAMPTAGSGAHFYTTGARFQAISLTNSGGQANDWGYTLIPENQLTQQAKVGWGAGRDPTSTVLPLENGSPVWLVAIGTGTMTICADYDGDGLGALTDSNGLQYDQLISLTNLQREKIFDTDGDQTGMLLYLCNGSEADLNNMIAVTWGQDPATATASSPGLDVGTTVPPLPSFTGFKGAELTDDINNDGKFDVGESFAYKIVITNVGALPISANAITVEDIVPDYTLYVPGTSAIYSSYTGLTTPIPDNTVPPSATEFPLDEGGVLINEQLRIDEYFEVTFEVKINADLPGSTTIKNQASVSGLDLQYDPNVEIVIEPPDANSRIGDFIWFDLDGDGVQDAGEPGIPGVTVELYDGSCIPGSTCLTDVTDANGVYGFPNLLEGANYTVVVHPSTLPAGLTLTGDPDGTMDGQHSVTLTALNKPYLIADFGYQGNVSIGDFVWYDIDWDGVQDGGAEVGLSGVTVNLTWAGPDGNLLTTGDNAVFTTVTNGSGAYNFTGLPAGTYSVDLDDATLPADYYPTTTDPLTLSNLPAGTVYTTADFGAAPGPGSISDYVWNDIDGDGVQDASESGIAGVTIWVDLDNDGVQDANEPYDVTDLNGNYYIDSLPDGAFTVRATGAPISGATPTYDLDGAGTANVASVTLTFGQDRTDVDWGYQFAALSITKVSDAGGSVNPGETIQYTITVRNNTASRQTEIAITDAEPTGTNYVSNSTVVSGWQITNSPYTYLDTFNPATYSNTNLGTATWSSSWDETGDNDSAANGSISINTNQLRFNNLDTDTIERPVDLSTASAATLTLDWTLVNGDEEVLVQLWNGTGWDNVGNTGQAASGTITHVLTSAQRIAGGIIRFATNTGPWSNGEIVDIDNVQFAFTVPTVTAVTKDNNPSGTNDLTGTPQPDNLVVAGDNFMLDPGQTMTATFSVDVDDPVSGGLSSIDNTAYVVSFQQPTPQSASVSDALPPAMIGDFVWLDANGNGVQDGEPGLGGVTVTLYASDGTTVIATTTTASDGSYSFSVAPGSYVVGFSLPSGYYFTAQDAGGNDALDSDADTTTGKTGVITVVAGQTYNTSDAGLQMSASAVIGDRIWLDEDADGVQDAGEAGIPNVTVELRDGVCTPGVDCPTVVTDSEGNYLFTDVAPGNYTVAVVSGLPAGLSANPTYDEDGIGTANTTAVTVSAGQEYVTADFGYNWTSVTDVNNPGPGATGAIGDRVWIDANGDGVQDPGEAGLAGVTVTLVSPGPDGIFGTGDDVTASTTTDAAGNYIFDGLSAGAYQVQVTAPGGYTQTGDPDGTLDNRTTAPIILSPGDVFVNADFGYQSTGVTNTIGNQIFVDANGDGNLDAGEPGIPGVTVALLDNSGNVIATTVTDENGQYSFPGLPNGTYTVWVNDTANVLGALVQNSTPDNAADGGQACGTCNGTNTVTVTGTGSDFQDFGYAPAGHAAGDGLIGDTIFLDRDGGNDFDPGEGLEGVIVYLFQDSNSDGNYDAGEPLVSFTTTDENGNYYFGNLPAGDYVVKVEPSTLPAGVTNTVDQGDATLNEGGTNLTAGEVDLTQDFGYRDTTSPNSVSGTIWNDTNADGTLSGESGIFENVTVVLYDSDGNIVATTQTDASGNYSFGNLPDGTYRVDVTDANNVLNGYWHSVGTQGEADDNQSKNDPYTITLSGGENRDTVDFGYYRDPAAVSDYVWLDRDNDGVQDADEPPLPGILVTLTVVYPNGDSASFSVRTDVDGLYSFENLLLDENYDGAGVGEPTYSLTFTTPTGTVPSPTGQGTPSTDSNGINPTVSPITEGQSDTTYDSGFFTDRLDLGDLPLSYPTLFEPGPAHIVFPDGPDADSNPDTTSGVPAVWLGDTVDVELDGHPSTDAYGDDSNITDDEDGLVLAATGWIAGGSSTATVTINGSESNTRVYFGYWIDWDNNGSLETFYSGSALTGSPTSVDVTVSVPAGYVPDTRVYMRVRASDAPLAIADYQGTRINGEVEDYWYQFDSAGVTTPVTLSYFLAQRQGNQVNFTWSTATETGNVGFNLYVVNGDTLTRINEELIPSAAIDSLSFQDYAFSASVDGDTYYIEDIDILGVARLHGPFQLGREYGGRTEKDRIDWDSILAEVARHPASTPTLKLPAEALEGDPGEAVEEPSVVIVEEGMSVEDALETPQKDESADLGLESLLGIEAASVGQQLTNTINLEVRQTGLYRVTYETLKAAGLDLRGVPIRKIMLTNRGQIVPIYVKGAARFGPGAYIEFYGQALDTIYTDANIYTVQVGTTFVPQIPVNNMRILRNVQPALSYAETLVVDNQKAYANYAPGEEIWYDTSMLAFKSPMSWSFPFEVNGLADPSASATMQLVVWGVTDWPQSPDHHLQVRVNGVAVGGQTFNGLVEQTLDITLPAGVLQEGANTLELILPGDTGVDWDLINFDKFSITYQRVFQARDGRLTFTAAGQAFKVTNLPSKNVVVYQLTQKGPVKLGQVLVQASGGSFTATFAGSAQSLTYLVATKESLYVPTMQAIRLQADLDQPAEYLIISHPNFINDLGPLVQARQAQGLTVSVVDVNDLYARYTYGIFDPQAIKQYISYASQNLGTEYVLLVGGDTYDYRNYLGLNSVSFIPSLYATTGPTVKMVPSDPLFVDVNSDNVPDLAIGRFPVRTAAELELMINKTLAYSSKNYGQTAFFAADKNDGAALFKEINAEMAASMPAGWTKESVSLDDTSVTDARSQLIAAMNRGTALVTFTGHSGPATWTFSNLFNTADAAALTNVGRPFVVVQWGCWNTYYVDPANNYLVQSFLFSGDRGAAAVLGAATLTDSESEALLGVLLTPRLATPGMSIGQALQDAKFELAQTHPDLLDVLLGWSLMGDPALVVQP